MLLYIIRLGAMHFESLLIDHDVCLNWGNWTYAAGVGSDPREDRYFSIPKQTSNYDPQHKFIKFWCEEARHMMPAQLTRQLKSGLKPYVPFTPKVGNGTTGGTPGGAAGTTGSTSTAGNPGKAGSTGAATGATGP